MWLALCVCVACAAGLHKTKLVIEEQETAGLLLWLRAYTDLNTPGSYSHYAYSAVFSGRYIEIPAEIRQHDFNETLSCCRKQ